MIWECRERSLNGIGVEYSVKQGRLMPSLWRWLSTYIKHGENVTTLKGIRKSYPSPRLYTIVHYD